MNRIPIIAINAARLNIGFTETLREDRTSHRSGGAKG